MDRRKFLQVGVAGLVGAAADKAARSQTASARNSASIRKTQTQFEQGSFRVLVRIDELLHAAAERNIPVPYQVVTRTVLKNFIVYVQEDIAHGRRDRALHVSEELEAMGLRTVSELEKILAEPSRGIDVPLYETGKVACREGGLFGNRRWVGTAKTDEGPVFLTGYGYFDQAVKDLDKFPRYGTNIVELGQDSEAIDLMFPAEDAVDQSPIYRLDALMDRAAHSNVAVDLMFPSGPLPGWLYHNEPHLLDAYGEYIRFDIDAPEARRFFEKYFQVMLSGMRGKASLFSFCLSNEPEYRESGKSVYSKRLWHEYLHQRHGTVETLNQVYGLSLTRFSDVPIPTLGSEQLYPPQLFYDWCVFNQERFNAWSKWQAEIVHGIIPGLTLHIKTAPTNTAPIFPIHVGWGIDPELTANLDTVAGCDATTFFTKKGPYVESSLLTYFLWYDLLYSVSGKPVYNSENHLIEDNDPAYVPPGHIRSMIWQGAIHGVSATVLWFWQRDYQDEVNASAASGTQPEAESWALETILTRPACVEAVGHTSLDLLRLAEEVRALQQAPQEVAILYSMPSFVYASRKYFTNMDLLGEVGLGSGKINYRFTDYYTAMTTAYEALMFTGQRISFVTEKQIQRGELAKFKVLIAPDTTNVQHATLAQIIEFGDAGGTILAYGSDQCLTRDEYDRTLDRGPLERLRSFAEIKRVKTGKELRGKLGQVFQRAGVSSPVMVFDTSNGEPSWGVEGRSAEHMGRLLVNLVNYTHSTKRVRLRFAGRQRKLQNLLTGDVISHEMELQPLEPVLLAAN